jgi:hypothetical protein
MLTLAGCGISTQAQPLSGILSRFAIVVYSFLVLCSLPLDAADSSSFEKVTNRAVIALKRDDLKAFLHMCSQSGLTIARRGVDSSQMEKANNPDTGAKFESRAFVDDPLGFEHNHLPLQIWVDEEAQFTSYKDEPALREALEKFRAELISGYGPVESSLNLTDEWGRNLGPAASGKICAGAFWFICFTQQNNQWKISRLEIALH